MWEERKKEKKMSHNSTSAENLAFGAKKKKKQLLRALPTRCVDVRFCCLPWCVLLYFTIFVIKIHSLNKKKKPTKKKHEW